MLTGIRKSLKVKSVGIKKRDVMTVDLEVEDEEWRVISVYNRMGKRDYLKNIEEVIEKGGWKKILIGGDFNAKTAEQGSLAWYENEVEEERRSSKDKTINKQGKDFLTFIEEMGLGILNGNIQEDEKGDMTFLGKKGDSVIDYAVCNAETWEDVHRLEIGNRVELDHRPLEITLEKVSVRKKSQEENKREVEDWSEERCRVYKGRLKERTEKAVGANEEWEEMVREIK